LTEQQEYNRKMIDDFRATRASTGVPLEGRPMLLLTHTGAKTGQAHTTPMMFVPDGQRLLVIASNIGAPKHPDWYHNLVAHPAVTVEAGSDTFEAVAATIEDPERKQVWERITAQYPFFVEHQAKTNRQIPVVALVRQTA
jgi:deazaflavin-dependent oxidoreductase (nitroreductase family)